MLITIAPAQDRSADTEAIRSATKVELVQQYIAGEMAEEELRDAIAGLGLADA